MSLSASAPWLKYYGEVPHHLTYPQKTIYQMVRDAAIRDAKLPAYEFMGKKTTFAQFMEKIDQTAQAFLAMGIQKGDRVTICMPNCPQALHAFYGLNRIGAVSNMIHPLSAAGEIKFYLNFSHSKCILTLDQFYAKIAPVMPELDNKDCKLLLAKIEDELYPLIEDCMKILSDDPLFFLINSYTTGLSQTIMDNVLTLTMKKKYGGRVSCDEIGLMMREKQMILPCGISCRWNKE